MLTSIQEDSIKHRLWNFRQTLVHIHVLPFTSRMTWICLTSLSTSDLSLKMGTIISHASQSCWAGQIKHQHSRYYKIHWKCSLLLFIIILCHQSTEARSLLQWPTGQRKQLFKLTSQTSFWHFPSFLKRKPNMPLTLPLAHSFSFLSFSKPKCSPHFATEIDMPQI